jgi:hypothetical protein
VIAAIGACGIVAPDQLGAVFDAALAAATRNSAGSTRGSCARFC